MKQFLLALAGLALFGCAAAPKKTAPQWASKPTLYRDTYMIEPQLKNANGKRLLIYLHGSDGPTKYSMGNAFELARSGFRVLHLCWYNCGKPYLDDMDPLKRIDLSAIAERLRNVMSDLKPAPESVYFVGVSRGAELATLLASHAGELDIRVDGVAVISGISVTAPSRNSKPRAARLLETNFGSSDPTWMIGARVIPNSSLIDVAKIDAPMMIVHGEDDKIWAVGNAYKLRDRYQLTGRRAKMLIFSDEGHMFTPQAQERMFEELRDFCKVRRE